MSARMFIQVPEDVEIELDVDRVSVPPITRKERFNFQRYFLQYLLDEPTVFGSVTGILDAAEIEGAFKNKSAPEVVALQIQLFEKLKKAMEARKFEGTVWRYLVPFIMAIKCATDKDPRGAAAPAPDAQPPS